MFLFIKFYVKGEVHSIQFKQHEHTWVKKKFFKVLFITEIAKCNGC